MWSKNEPGYSALTLPESAPLLQAEASSGPVSARNLCEEDDDSDLDIVQFSMAQSIVGADAGFVELDVMRLGRKTGKSTYAFRTEENSAKAGKQFEHTSGTIVMLAGEDQTRIRVPIYNCLWWNPTTEFKVILSNLEGCTLGMYLKEVRVKVIDATTFPTDEFTKQVVAGEIEHINHISLYKGFMEHFIGENTIWWRSFITIFLDQLKNAYYYVKLVLSIYMVDTLLDLDSTEGLIIKDDRLGTAYVVAILYVGPPLLFIVTDSIVLRLDISGLLRRNMQRDLFTKYMNYTMECLQSYSTSELVDALSEDVNEAVKGFTSLLDLIRLAGKFLISVYFLLIHNPSLWWVALMVPGLMLAWAACRTHVFVAVSEASGAATNKVVDFLHESMSKLSLISTYGQRPQINDIFAQKSEDLRKVLLPEKRVHMTNMCLPDLLGPVLSAFYIAVAVPIVVNGKLELGLFLGTLNVFGSICADFSEVFRRLMDIISTFENLTTLTTLFNNPTDLKQVQQRNIMLAEETGRLRQQDKGSQSIAGPYVPRVDRLKIEIREMSFSYGDFKVFEGVNCECEQGVICAIKAIPGLGRKTFTDLLALRIFPKSGIIFIPSHLRVLYVTSQVTILKLSIWQNLVFGNPKNNNPHRVEKILQHFNMKRTLELCQTDCDDRKKIFDAEHAGTAHVTVSDAGDDKPDSERKRFEIETLSETEQMDICLTRAFVMNPEVLVLDRPFVHYHSKQDNDALIAAISAHRNSRGFLLPEKGKMHRRPRTVFLTTDRTDIIKEVADIFWMLPTELGGPCHIQKPDDALLTEPAISMFSSAQEPSLQSVNGGLAGQRDVVSLRAQPNNQGDNDDLLGMKSGTTSENLWPLRRKLASSHPRQLPRHSAA